MPQTEIGKVRRVLRALTPLSGLPLLSDDLDDEAIAGRLASVLVKIIDADFAYLILNARQHVVELAWAPEGRVPAALIPAIRTSLAGSPFSRPGKICSALTGELVTVLSTPLRFKGEATLVVGSKRCDYPTAVDRLILRMAANEAMAAMEREQSLAIARHLAKLVSLSSNFIGVANLQGMPLFVNQAGLRLVGMAGIQEALELHVVDFLDFRDRDRARYEVWPEVLYGGRWSGQLSFLNAKTGMATPLLVECFRIDAPTGEPVAVGTISIDIRNWNLSETGSHDEPDLQKTRQAMLAVARIESLSERERQVLSALVAGHSHKVIAHELGISVRTIEVHRSRMMRRLGVRTLAEAIKLAIISGAID
ncbi:LuxR C-terminal-related transcriptional regulator [Mesorhizobium sp. CAU 1741]|uniref:LuxR C-terminal-related transcriptional regulator n=1 Tax=Mesorhizobium sp. CAU 1741 TaxID=3140366 RepID=UPI00325A6AA7